MNITSLRRRLTPSTIIATVALVAASAGSAAAAGQFVVDDPSDIAPGVVSGLHVKQQSIGKPDLDDPYLRVKVNPDGSLNGSRNDNGGNVVKTGPGGYDVTFNSSLINGSDGSSDESLLSKNCALSAQARDGLSHIDVSGPSLLKPNTVHVRTLDLNRQNLLFGGADHAFDLIAVC